MATIDLGKIKQVFRGTYNNATAYVPDDIVVFTDGTVTSTYICTTATTGNNPSSGGTAHGSWAYLAKGQTASPTTTQGDLVFRGASADQRLAIGTAGQVLKVNSGANGYEFGTGADPQRSAGAWCTYKSDATVSIYDSYNCSSITDNAAGAQTVNFIAACANTDYSVAGTATYPSGTNNHFITLGSYGGGMTTNGLATGSCKIYINYINSSAQQDVRRVTTIFFGDWS